MFANGSAALQKLGSKLSEIDPAHKPEGADKGVQAEDGPLVEVFGICASPRMGDLERGVENQVGHCEEGEGGDRDKEDGRRWEGGRAGVCDVPVRDYQGELVRQVINSKRHLWGVP